MDSTDVEVKSKLILLLTKIAHWRELLTVRKLIDCNTSGAIEQVWLEKDMPRDYYIKYQILWK